MFVSLFSKLFSILKKIPLRLWGISLLCTLLCSISTYSLILIPILAIILNIAMQFGMKTIFLSAYKDESIDNIKTEQIFFAFKKERFFRIVGGMLWMSLWILIWGILPMLAALVLLFVMSAALAGSFNLAAMSFSTIFSASLFVGGIVISIIKSYSYRFTPYILATDDEISPTDALKKSIEMTKGFKGIMFGCDVAIPLAFSLAIGTVGGLLFLLAKIPFVGVIFGFALALFIVLVLCLSPLLTGLLDAGYFVEAQNAINNRASAQPAAPQAPIFTAPQEPTYTAPAAPTPPVTPVAPTYTVPQAPIYTAPQVPTYTAPQAPQADTSFVKPQPACPVCGEPVNGPFCPRCGHKHN